MNFFVSSTDRLKHSPTFTAAGRVIWIRTGAPISSKKKAPSVRTHTTPFFSILQRQPKYALKVNRSIPAARGPRTRARNFHKKKNGLRYLRRWWNWTRRKSGTWPDLQVNSGRIREILCTTWPSRCDRRPSRTRTAGRRWIRAAPPASPSLQWSSDNGPLHTISAQFTSVADSATPLTASHFFFGKKTSWRFKWQVALIGNHWLRYRARVIKTRTVR